MTDVLIRAGSFAAIILLGYVLKKIGLFKEADFPILSNVVMKITFPAAIVTSLNGRVIEPGMLVLLPLAFCCGLLYMLVAVLVNIRSTKEQRAFDILNLPGYNIGTFALPFTQSFLGPVGVLITSIFDVGNAFICFGGSFSIARAVKEGGKADFRRVLKAPLTSLPFLTYAVMLVLHLNHLSPPKVIVSFAEILAGANAFLAMLMLGVGLNLSADRSKLGIMAKILLVRFGVAAVLALCYYYLLPFDLEVRQTLVILAFSPIGSTIPVYTAELGEDVGLSSATNSAAILISIPIIITLLTVML